MAIFKLIFAIVLCLVQQWQSEAAAVKKFQHWAQLKADIDASDYSMVDFYTTWCPHCNTLAPNYEKAGEIIEKGKLKEKFKLIKIECDSKEGRPICAANHIQGYPTILVYQKGKNFEQYKGGRTPEAFVHYVEKVVETGKPQYDGKHADSGEDQKVCLAKDYKKYVTHKS